MLIMRYVCPATVAALSILVPSLMLGQANAPVLAPNDVTVGQNLQTVGTIALKGATTREVVEVTLTSNDPSRVLLSPSTDVAGSASIVIKLQPGFRETPVFAIQGLGKSGTVTYTASAPGFTSGTGKVTLGPSGIVIAGPFGIGRASFLATIGSEKPKILIHSALLDPSLSYVAAQRVIPGRTVNAKLTSSNPAVGTITAAAVIIAGGASSATIEFQPATPGETAVAVNVPAGFSAPATQFTTVTAKVFTPGMILDDIILGQNLQTVANLGLGGPASGSGVVVTLASSDPSQLLLSLTATDKGSNSITVRIPPGEFRTAFYLQALGGSGKVTYSASAPGFRTRTATVTLTPSGVAVAGPLSFTRSGASPGFVASLAAGKPTPLLIYTVYLDPVTHRSADVTVQPLRAGLTLRIELTSSNPSVGTVASPVTIMGGSDTGETHFTPLKAGMTAASVITPAGYTQSSNATSLKVIVTE